MRFGVVSDSHGNLAALDAVLDTLATEDVEAMVNLGDLFSGGVQPGATARWLRALDHLVIRGNHERQLLDFPLDQLRLSDRLAQAELTADDMD
jgi:predicted phosphodiesterase